MHGIVKRVGWGLMLLLALGVAGYAGAVLADPAATGSGVVRTIFAERPLAAWMHVGGGLVALVVGPFQFLAGLRARRIRLHRWLGRIYLIGILVGGLGGLRLAFDSVGGWGTHAGFGLLAVAWLTTGAMAYRTIRAGRVAAHRGWMIRNYSLTYAAVTLRLWLGLGTAAGVAFLDVYQVVAWACWIPNLLVAEWVVARLRQAAAPPELAVSA